MSYIGTKPANALATTEQIGAGAVQTIDIADSAVTPAKLSQKLTQGTAVASTSGTAIDFTGIPSWAKRITVMFSGVSTNGTSNILLQIGTSSGVEITSYVAAVGDTTSAGAANYSTATNGFLIGRINTGADAQSGAVTLLNLTGSVWVQTGNLNRSSGGVSALQNSAGTKTLSGTLDRVRITSNSGTDTFDAGSINIMYEG